MRHFLDFKGLTDPDIEHLLTRTQAFSRSPRASGSALNGLRVANLFYEASTRTRVSFEVAAGRLGMGVINISATGSSVEKGESLRDTLETLAEIGIHAAVVRHPQTGVLQRLVASGEPGLCLVNAGDGVGSHPSQALLDAATLRSSRGTLEGMKLVIAGDIRHSRVAASVLELFPRLGVGDIHLVGPPQLLPEICPSGARTMGEDFDSAIESADVVMMLRVQRERIEGLRLPSRQDYFSRWGLGRERLRRAAEDCLVLHPGPVNRGMEISDEVADGPRSLIRRQVAMGVPARMAIMEHLLERL